jgi:hypothetical protein
MQHNAITILLYVIDVKVRVREQIVVEGRSDLKKEALDLR